MTSRIISCIQNVARHQRTALWLVGGPVRDGLLGRACADWDMVCRKAKRTAQETARRIGAKWIALDEQNRIYRVILPESLRPVHTLDFAELQGRTIVGDLKRRDFTVNAMARAFPSGQLVDPFHGKKDLRRKTIRAVSEKAFTDDPLRLLRAFRFQTQFQFDVESRTLRWIRKHHDKLSTVSAERIRDELLRLWKQPGSSASLRMMDRAGLLSVVFPEMEACRRTAVRYYGKGGVLTHSFETVENLEWILEYIRRYGGAAVTAESADAAAPPLRQSLPLLQPYLAGTIGGYPRSAWLKWAAFLHDIGKPATAKVIKGRLRFFEHEHLGAGLAVQAARRLRCSRQEAHLLGLWVQNHMRTGNLAAAARVTDKAFSRFFRDLGEEGVGMVLVSLADHYTYLSKALRGKGKDPVEKMGCQLLHSFYDRREKILPGRLLNGHDLMRHLKLKPGPIIGKLLEAVQDAQAEGRVTTKNEALAFAKKKL